MNINTEIVDAVRKAIDRDRLVKTAVALVEVPSPTRSAAAVEDRLEGLLREDGFDVERVEAGWPEGPAVVARYETGRPGRTLQMNGHLDTIHLPFVAPRVENGMLYGSGASDMKGGIAAACEAMRALRDSGMLLGGGILMTAHDLHEIPWGDGSQVDGLIDAGYVGDAVLLPEYLSDCLPVVGRGLAILEVVVTREGEPVHETLGGIDQPSVIAAGADIIRRLAELDGQLAVKTHPLGGRESAFVGQVHSGEIFNQSPTELRLSGTRRWLRGTSADEVERQYYDLLSDVAGQFGTKVDGRFVMARDAFELEEHPFVEAFQSSCQVVMGRPLPEGAKPFVDDGNTFIARGGVPAITHGPDAKGAHTLHEEVPVDELVRVALVYSLAAIAFCSSQ